MTNTSLPAAPFRVALIGAGIVGTAVARLLSLRGHRIVGVASRGEESATRSADLLGSSIFSLGGPLPEADLVLLGVPEAALDGVVGTIGPELRPGQVVVHFAGVVGITPLDRAAQAGAYPLALHPVQACPDIATALARLPGAAWGITCPAETAPWADEFVRRDLQGTSVHVSEEARPLWHAAAAVTANGLTALLTLADEILRRAQVADPFVVLAPLARGVITNAVERGAPESLTGPIVRGDVATVEAHLGALAGEEPLRRGYIEAARMTLAAATLSDRFDSEARGALEEVLERV